jgi:hypothetical protein
MSRPLMSVCVGRTVITVNVVRLIPRMPFAHPEASSKSCINNTLEDLCAIHVVIAIEVDIGAYSVRGMGWSPVRVDVIQSAEPQRYGFDLEPVIVKRVVHLGRPVKGPGASNKYPRRRRHGQR